jgi:hypothetical protein
VVGVAVGGLGLVGLLFFGWPLIFWLGTLDESVSGGVPTHLSRDGLGESEGEDACKKEPTQNSEQKSLFGHFLSLRCYKLIEGARALIAQNIYKL